MANALQSACCALCREPLGQTPAVTTTGGERVHIACADQDAGRAHRVRVRARLVQGLLLVGSIALHVATETSGWTVLVSILLVFVAARAEALRLHRAGTTALGRWKVRGRRGER